MKYFDAHIHLTDDHFSNYIGYVLPSLRSLKIRACSVTVDLTTSKKSLILFNNQNDIITQFIGIHPEFALKENIEEFQEFFISNLKYIDGIGEIGFDPHILIKMRHNILPKRKCSNDYWNLLKNITNLFQFIPESPWMKY